MSLHHLGAAKHLIARIGRIGVEILGIDGLVTQRFAGKRRLVHAELHGVKQLAVGGYLVSGIDQHDVAHHHIAPGHRGRAPVADHLHRLVVVDLIQNAERCGGLLLENERQPRGQQYRHKYSYRLEKDFPVLPESEIFVERDPNRQHTRYKQNDDQGIGKFSKKFLPPGRGRRRCQHVGTMLPAAFGHFGVCKSGISHSLI